jgi:hypothetical protein
MPSLALLSDTELLARITSVVQAERIASAAAARRPLRPEAHSDTRRMPR